MTEDTTSFPGSTAMRTPDETRREAEVFRRETEASLVAAKAEASRRIDEGLAQARARSRAIIDEAQDEADRIRRAAEADAQQIRDQAEASDRQALVTIQQEQSRLDELRGMLLDLCAELDKVGSRLGDRLDDVAGDLRAQAGE